LPAANRDGKAEFNSRRIPTAAHFDINGPGLSDKASTLPHMLPSAREFAPAAAALGISKQRTVCVYDGNGLFSAARVWWHLRAMGHTRVAVLEGGLPRWLAEGRALDEGAPAPPPVPVAEEEWSVDPAAVRSLAQVVAASDARRAAAAGGAGALRAAELLVDARPAGRFAGAEPEPRAGLRSGHAPLARSVPHSAVLDAARHNALLPRERLVEVFRAAGVDIAREGAIVTSCGSGVTGCVLALALAQAGRPVERTALYDGSWAEYGSISSLEVAVGAAEPLVEG